MRLPVKLAVLASGGALALAPLAPALADGGGHHHHGHKMKEVPCIWVDLSGTGYQPVFSQDWGGYGGGQEQSEAITVTGVKALVCEKDGNLQVVKVDSSNATASEVEAQDHGQGPGY